MDGGMVGQIEGFAASSAARSGVCLPVKCTFITANRADTPAQTLFLHLDAFLSIRKKTPSLKLQMEI